MDAIHNNCIRCGVWTPCDIDTGFCIKCATEVSYVEQPRVPETPEFEEDTIACPLCNSFEYDEYFCPTCGYESPPEGLEGIELEHSADEYSTEANE